MVEYIHGMDEIRVRFSAGPLSLFFLRRRKPSGKEESNREEKTTRVEKEELK